MEMAEHTAMDDDRFRVAGSKLEDDEPVAFALYSSLSHVDWVSSIPKDVLWVPETLFHRMQDIAAKNNRRLLAGINIYTQTRLNKAQAKVLIGELTGIQLPAGNEMLDECVALVRGKAEECANSGDNVELLIEGP